MQMSPPGRTTRPRSRIGAGALAGSRAPVSQAVRPTSSERSRACRVRPVRVYGTARCS